MTQTLYAHMNKIKIKIKNKKQRNNNNKKNRCLQSVNFFEKRNQVVKFYLKLKMKPRVVVHVCNPHTQKAEEEGS
jgi:CRISPR/Cas system CMR subunit Cmr6 (Cas7 group RAMP superfamily)